MILSKPPPGWIAAVFITAVLAIVLAARVLHEDGDEGVRNGGKLPVPVEVAPVETGPIATHRSFSGTLEAHAQFTVAPKVGGRIQLLHVGVSDTVVRGQVVAQLDDEEFKQAVAEAEASLSVAGANLVEAENRLEIAQRSLTRTKALQERGITPESALDSALAEFLARQAGLEVAKAVLRREEAALAASKIRLGYTKVTADWQEGDNERIVADRFIDDGNTVAANTPLLSIVELNPILAVIHITEKDYPRISIGREVSLLTDAFPNRTFTGSVVRIAPIFRASSRQARVEVSIPNVRHELKPGMFARCTLEIDRAEDATVIPDRALALRNGSEGVFLVNNDNRSVRWVDVKTGLRESESVQVVGSGLSGRVVTMGQQLIEDGSAITIPGDLQPDEKVNSSP